MAAKFDLKTFFINHSEKVVGGVVALLALWGFASASWDHADEVPSELLQAAGEVRTKIENNSFWPPEKQEAFTKDMPDIRYLAGELGERDDIDYARFTMPVNWHEPLVPPREKRSNVVVLAPVQPEVSPVAVPLAMPLDDDESEEDPVDQEEQTEEEEEVESARRLAAKKYGGDDGTGMSGSGRGGLADNVAGLLGVGANGGFLNGLGAGNYGGYDEEEDEDDYFGGQGRFGPGGPPGATSGRFGGAGAILPTADRKVRWHAGISVRMVVDLQEQRREIREALQISGDYAEIQHHVDYQQIHIERIEQQDGMWSEWEELKHEDIGEVLQQSLGQDVDIVSPAVTRPELTMPLPRRAVGVWLNEEASHSMITDFELSPEEQEMQNRIDAMILADAQKTRETSPQRKPKKGFTPFLNSRRDLARRAQSEYGSRAAQNESMQSRMQNFFTQQRGGFGDREQKIFDKQLEETATADFRLLLVRFIDFTAARGVEYRYRVRLEMYNPNYRRLADDLESPELAEQETIMSAWGEPTPAVQVPMHYRNYAKKVKSSRYGQHTVEFGVYYEDDGLLPVLGTVAVDVGMPIAGNQHTERVDLEVQVLEGGDVSFTTDELLCGVLPTTRLNSRDHKDLEQILKKLGRQQPVGDLVTVVDSRGDLVMKYADSSSKTLKYDQEMVDFIVLNYDDWRADKGPENALGEFSGGRFGGVGVGDDDDDDYEDGGSRGRRGRGRGRTRRGLGMSPGSALGLQNFRGRGGRNR